MAQDRKHNRGYVVNIICAYCIYDANFKEKFTEKKNKILSWFTCVVLNMYAVIFKENKTEFFKNLHIYTIVKKFVISTNLYDLFF